MNFKCDDWRVVVVNGIKYDDYRVDKDGRLYSVRTGLFIKGSLNNKGYVKVSLIKREGDLKTRKTYSLHRVVLESFNIPKPEGCNQVDHINGNKQMNSLDNLEWVDCKTNVRRSWKNGLHDNDIRYGEHAGNSKYTTEQIELACKLKEGGMKTSQISKKLNIPLSTLSKIFTGKQWLNISSKYKL